MGDTRPPSWILALGAVFVAYLCMLGWSELWGPERPGIVWTFQDGAVAAEAVVPGSPADKAGVARGDRLVMVGGHAIRHPFDWLTVLAHLQVGHTYRLELERAGQRVHTEATLGRTPWSAFSSEGGTGWVFFLGARVVPLLLAFVVAFGRPHDAAARMGTWLLATIATTAEFVPAGMAAVWRALPPVAGAPLWIPFASLFAIGPLLVSFFAIFPRRLVRSPWIWALVWLPAAVEVVAVAPLSYRLVYEATSGPGDFDRIRLLQPVLFLYLPTTIAVLVLNYRRLEQANEKRRLRVLVIGALVGLLSPLPGMLAMLLFGPGVAHSRLARAGSLLFLAFPLAFAYALLRQRLFDVRLLVRRGLQYALARRVLLSVIPVLTGLLALDLLQHGEEPLFGILRRRGWVYAALGGLGLLAQSRRERWLHALDRRFFRERYDAQRLLGQVVEEAARAQRLSDVAERVVAAIETSLHPGFVALLVRERGPGFAPVAMAPPGRVPPELTADDKLVAILRILGRPLELASGEGRLVGQLPPDEVARLRVAKLDLLVPIALGANTREALVALGEKRSEEPYSGEDQALLGAIAASLAQIVAREGAASGTAPGDALVLASRYRLGRELGRGGMGTVHAATDGTLRREVAVKLIREDVLGRRGGAERFRREAQAAAAFTHPNVVTVHDFGLEPDGRAFLVMELLEGHDLGEELERHKRLTSARTLEVLSGVCAAVDAAHGRHLVHADLKPANVFLARGLAGELPKVLDFGVAKFLPEGDVSEWETATRALAGTPRYMAPEQLAGGPAQPGWDLWAIAVMAYEMLTGAHPFAGSGADRMAAVMTGRVVPPAAYLPEGPAHLEALFSRCLSVDPARRPASGIALLRSLSAALVTPPSAAPP